MSDDLALLPATELVALYRSKKASPVEATEAVLGRIERFQPAFNAFRQVEPDSALADARAAEGRWAKGAPAGPADGVPATVKDIILTKGWPSLRGSKTVDPNQDWPDDAPATARLRESGSVILGKTTTPEFGWKGVTDSPLTGITRNPWNPEKTPGGSSGGAAAACAVGMGALHLGTDGGGSIRIPCAFTGLFGIKCTFGTVPAWPPSPFGTLANIGPMTRTVEDAALMLDVITRPDPRDWYALPRRQGSWFDGLEDGVKGLRVGVARAPGGQAVDPEIGARFEEALAVFESLGATLVDTDPPIEGSADVFRKHWFAGAAHLLASIPEDRYDEMDPGLVHSAKIGAAIPLVDYVSAVNARQAIGLRLHAYMNDFDLLLTPTLPIPAFDVGNPSPCIGDDTKQWVDWTPFSYPFNLSRQPAASVPCGLTADGLPAGLQIVGSLYDDALVMRAARAFEREKPWELPPAATA